MLYVPTQQRAERTTVPLTWMPRMVALAWFGVFLIAVAYAMGRSSETLDSVPLMWAGQILLFTPIVFRMLQRDTSAREAFFGATALVLGSYLIKVCYSPIGFRFPDELQHYRTLTDLVATGGVSTRNPALPISPSYPGIELVTAALMQLSELPYFPAALIVVALAHLALAWTIFHMIRALGGSARVAGLAVAVYATQPHYQHFDSMFIYQALGLTFVALCLWCLVKASDRTGGRPRLWLALSALFGIAVVPTHHISTYMLVGMLFLALVVQLVLRQWHVARHSLLVFSTVAVATGVWILFVGTDTALYFEPAAQQLADSVLGFIHPDQTRAAPPPQFGSLLDRWLAYASVILTGLAVAWGIVQLRRTERSRSWVWVMIVASLTFFAALGVRLVASEGAELYGRAVSFIFIPVAFVVAIVMRWLLRWRRVGLSVAIVSMVVIWLGGLTSGWPPAWQRVPTGYLPGGFESSTDAKGIQASEWVASHMPPYGWYWATDSSNYTLVSAIGRQVPNRNASPLFRSQQFTRDDLVFMNRMAIRYVLSDIRLSQDMPADGSYYSDDPMAFRYTEPMSTRQLRKFDRLPAASRLYDNGSIVIYDVEEVSRAVD